MLKIKILIAPLISSNVFFKMFNNLPLFCTDLNSWTIINVFNTVGMGVYRLQRKIIYICPDKGIFKFYNRRSTTSLF